MDGLLVVDKPAGLTSHDVVARVRRLLRERRIGHTGTLDPAATGVLPLVIGRATRLARFLTAGEKSYAAVIRLGWATDTGDAEGVRLERPDSAGAMPMRETIDRALDEFRGTFVQQPPVYSAKKIAGKRSHKLARARARSARLMPSRDESGGPAAPDPHDPPDLPDPVRVTTHALDIVRLEGDTVTLRVDCSAGFYVRSLAHDLGERLRVGAHLVQLRRVRSGEITESDALPLTRLEQDPEFAARSVIPMSRMLTGLPAFVLADGGLVKVKHGRDLGPGDTQAPLHNPQSLMAARLLTPDGDLVGIAERRASGLLHPIVVLL